MLRQLGCRDRGGIRISRIARADPLSGCAFVRPKSQVRIFSTQNVKRRVVTSAAVDQPDDKVIDGSVVSKDHAKLQRAKGGSAVAAYLDLAKAKLSTLVVATTAAGFIAAGGPISTQLDVLAACVAGTALCSSSAAAWNQIIEREQDQRMKRTQQRPLVAGTLTPPQAMTAASLWGVAGGSVLLYGTDPVTTALGVGNLVLYAGIYTAMKPRSIYNTWVGAVVGAIPPVMGWSAATGGSIWELEPMLLASTLYLWQMPHFFALSYMHRVDYKRGGFQMVPCLEEDGKRTAELIVRYAWYLAAVPLVATATGVTSSMFAFEGIALNAYALKVAHDFQRDRTNAKARTVFMTSLWYLPSLLMLFLLHSKVWDEDKNTEDDRIGNFLNDMVHAIRAKGRDLCIHEAAVSKTPHGEDACPVTVGTKKSQQTVDTAVSTASAALATDAATLKLPAEARKE